MSSIIPANTPILISEAPLMGMMISNRVCAGFPSQTEDRGAKRIDLNQVLITHDQATYFIRTQGHFMVNAGIFDNDLLVVGKAIKPRHGDIVVAVVDDEFAVKQLYQRQGRIKLKAANPTYPDIVPKNGQTLEIWGVVMASVKPFRT